MGAGQGPSGRGRDCCVYPSKYVLGLNGFSAFLGMEKMVSYWREFPQTVVKQGWEYSDE